MQTKITERSWAAGSPSPMNSRLVDRVGFDLEQ
jgi:hypothetical protein